MRTGENIVPKLKITINNWKKLEMDVIPLIVRKSSLATLSLNMLSSTHKNCKHSLDALFYLDSSATDHICNTRDLYSTFESHTQTFTVPGGTTTTEGIGTINLQVLNFQTGNVDTMTLTNVAYMPMSQILNSTWEDKKK
jgi:hypothetical protein